MSQVVPRLSIKFTLFATVFLNLLTWQLIIPIWHFPDEQAHFGQVAFRAEHGRVQRYHELSTSREIAISEELLGTQRDSLGNNRFTYHPEFKIEYSQSNNGPHEAEVKSLNNHNYRETELVEESTRYPLLYYYLASKVYNLSAQGDLFTRVYAVRFFSIIIFIATVLIIYAFSKLIFIRNSLLQISLTSLIVFMPMFVFSSSGVTSDGLFNFLFMLSMYLITKILFVKSSWKEALFLTSAIVAGIAVKFQFQTIWLLVLFAIVVTFWKLQFKGKLILLGILTVISPMVLMIVNFLYFFVNDYGIPGVGQLIRLPIIPEIETIVSSNPFSQLTIGSHLSYTMQHTIREILPWYFGVYKWLSLALPPIVYQIINRILLLSFIGLIVWLFKIIQKRKFDLQAKTILFLGYGSLAYFGALTIFDWLFTKTHGFSFGIQGRYFFPTIIAHISLVLIGLLTISPRFLKKWVAIIFVVGMILFNYFSLFWVALHYYDLSSFDTFIRQASQYKPEIFKGAGVVLILSLTLVSTSIYLYDYLKIFLKSRINYKDL